MHSDVCPQVMGLPGHLVVGLALDQCSHGRTGRRGSRRMIRRALDIGLTDNAAVNVKLEAQRDDQLRGLVLVALQELIVTGAGRWVESINATLRAKVPEPSDTILREVPRGPATQLAQAGPPRVFPL